MRNIYILCASLIFMALALQQSFAQTGVSINSTGAAPDANAILDITSTDKGVLLPRVTTAQRTAIAPTASSDFGMLVYDTDTDSFWYWSGTGWEEVPNVNSLSSNTLDEAYDEGGAGAGRVINADAGNVEIQGTGHLTVAANVGIGTTAPDRRMKVSGTGWTAIEVENTDNQDAAIELTSQGVSNYVFTDNTGFLGLESSSGQGIALRTDGANERVVVQSDGRLRVNNLADPSNAIITSNPAGVLGKVPLTGSATDVMLGTGVFGPASAFADHDWYQALSTNTPTGISDWIYTDGHIGIGTGSGTNPTAPLYVVASGAGNPAANSILAVNQTNSSGQDAIITARVAGSSAGDPFYSMDISGEAGWSMGADNSHDNRFKIAPAWDNLSYNTALTIKTDGNVGVGTDDPTSRVSVTGTNTDNYPALGLRSGNDNTGFNNGAQIVFGYNGTNNYGHFIQTRHNSANSNNAIDFYVSDGTQYNSVTSGSVHNLSLVSGNVGIGTTAPASVFQISTTQTGNVSKLHNPSLANGSLVGHEFGKANSTNNMAEFRYNHVSDGNPSNWVNLGLWGNANTLNVVATGNVGIGTTSPAQKLEVAGSARITSLGGSGDRLVYTNNSGDLLRSTSAINANSLIDGSGAANRVSYWSDANSLTSSSEFLYSSTGNLSVYNAESSTAEVRLGAAWNRPGVYSSQQLELFSDQTGIIFGDSDVERMRLTAAGNLGIGNTNPVYKIQVNGTAEASTYYVNHGSGNVLEVGDDAWIGDVNAANTVGITGQQSGSNGGLRLGTNTSAYLYGNGSANIGVGTTTPSGKLHVAAGEGDGIVIGVPNDNMGNNGGSYAIKFYGYRDVVSNAIGAKISAERTNVCCGWLSQGTELAFYTNNGLTTSNADNSVERVRITGGGTLEAKAGLKTERHMRFYKRSRSNGQGGVDNLGNYDFCYLAGVAFRNSDSNIDEDDDYQCNVYSQDINASADYNEGENEDFSNNFSYSTRPYWKLYSECYQDCSNSTCTAICINFDY